MNSIMDKLGKARWWAADVTLHPERYDQTAAMLVDIIRVVELLAMERDDKPRVTHVDDTLIARLATVAAEAFYRDESGKERDFEKVVRAVLAEFGRLDKPTIAPVGHGALPTAREILDAWSRVPGIIVEHRAALVVEMVRARVMPELAARDKRIAELEAEALELDKQIPGHGPALEGDGARLRQIVAGGKRPIVDDSPTEAQLEERWERRANEFSQPYRVRITELKKQLEDTNAIHRRLDDLGIATARATMRGEAKALSLRERVAELAERLQDRTGEFVALETQLGQALEERDSARGEAASRKAHQDELEKCLAEATSPLTVDRKTPEQVFMSVYEALFFDALDAIMLKRRIDSDEILYEEREGARDSAMEAGIQAVFRAFGPTIAKQAAVEALERLRKRLMPTDLSEHYNINTQTIQKAFDAETTFLEAPTPVPCLTKGCASLRA